jgi:hypothetical protein
MTFADYVLDRKYVRNVSEKTLAWYRDIERAFPKLNTESRNSSGNQPWKPSEATWSAASSLSL